MTMKILKWSILFMMIMGLTVACDDDDDDNGNQPQEQTIAAIVEANADFSVLADALDRTDLTSVLANSSAEFTVFAPDNAAFQALLNDLGYAGLDELENALGTATLKNILLYHVLGAELKSDAVTSGYLSTQAVNANNNQLSSYINVSGGVRLNGSSSVTDPDIEASNGVIHRINAVITPLNVAELITVNDASFSSLEAALTVADGDLVTVLSDPNASFTVFAPDDDAFTAVINATNSGDLTGLVQTLGGTDVLAEVLTYHVVASELQSEDVSNGSVATVNGANITLSSSNGVQITDGQGSVSTVSEANITGTNGVIHMIDGVLLP